MRVKIHKRGGPPIIVEDFDVLVVETEGGAPVAVAARYGPDGMYVVSSRDDDKRFEEVIRKLGLHKTVIVTNASDLLKPDHSLQSLI